MKNVELLAPAGNMNSLIAGIQAGANAVYLSGNSFGARAYANNFNNEELKEAVNYAHIHNVKVYVTINTLIYDEEFGNLDLFLKFLHEIYVDAVIVQDLGVIKFIKTKFPSLDVHASTQLNVFNKQGAENLLKMGVSRVVVARETPLEVIKEIVQTGIEVEVFIHGALCFSSSGNCLLSSMIGGRSGNRGKCAQPCRKLYSLKENNEVIIKNKALMSTKDLMTIEYLDSILDAGVVSLKIEGRMKSPEYVYTICSAYQKTLNYYYDHKKINLDNKTLNNMLVVFNRKFTKGYILEEENSKITNIDSVNHQGIVVGKIIYRNNDYIDIKLTDTVNLHDGLRVLSKNELGISVTQMLINGHNVKTAYSKDNIRIYIKNNVSINDVVVKTFDYALKEEIDEILKNDKIKTPLTMTLSIFNGHKLKLEVGSLVDDTIICYGDIIEYSDRILSEDRIKEQLSKLTDTPYYLKNLKIKTDNQSFLKISQINNIRRTAVELLNKQRTNKLDYNHFNYDVNVSNDLLEFSKEIDIECVCTTDEQRIICQNLGINNIYTLNDSYSGRINENSLKMIHNIGQLGNINQVISPYFNIMNSFSLSVINDFGINKCYLGLELSLDQIESLKLNNYNMNIGILSYGSIDLMVSKHCIVGKMKGYLNKNCNCCLNNNYSLVDEYQNEFPLILEKNNNCTMRILNNKKINLINHVDKLIKIGISKFLLVFTNESRTEIENIINLYKEAVFFNKKFKTTEFSGFLEKKVL